MPIEGTFSTVPVEADTRILGEGETRIRHYDALHQEWFWEGIRAQSLIFVAKDVASLDDVELEALARESSLVRDDSQVTIKRDSGGFTFINFNFIT